MLGLRIAPLQREYLLVHLANGLLGLRIAPLQREYLLVQVFDPQMPLLARLLQQGLTLTGVMQLVLQHEHFGSLLQASTQCGKNPARFTLIQCNVRVGRLTAQLQQFNRLPTPHQQNTQAIAMGEVDRGILS